MREVQQELFPELVKGKTHYQIYRDIAYAAHRRWVLWGTGKADAYVEAADEVDRLLMEHWGKRDKG